MTKPAGGGEKKWARFEVVLHLLLRFEFTSIVWRYAAIQFNFEIIISQDSRLEIVQYSSYKVYKTKSLK